MESFLRRENVDYISNFYRHKLFDEETKTYLVTVDDGSFVFLNLSAFRQLKRGKIESKEVFDVLEQNGVILTLDNVVEVIDRSKRRYAFLEQGVSLHIVAPSNRCSLACKYCFANPAAIFDDAKVHDMTEEIAKKTVEFIMQSPSYAITIEFTGGEALLRFDILKLMTNYARELNESLQKDLRFTVVSNLTLMNEEYAKWLIENDVTICTSLDGPKEVHDANRIYSVRGDEEVGSFDRVYYWIKRLNQMYEEYGSQYRVNALMTTTKHSMSYFKEIIDLYVELGVDMVDIRAMGFVGRAAENLEANDENYFGEEEFIEFYEKSLKYINELQSRGVNISERMTELYEQKVLERTPIFHSDFESPWGAGTGTLSYHSNGLIYACHEAIGKDEFILGNVRKDKWNDIYKRPEMMVTILSSLLENNVICDRDVYKPYNSTIPIENLYKFGKFNFYPSKTTREYETKFHCDRIFREEFDKLNLK